MTIDLTQLDIANKALQADSKAAASARKYGAAATAAIHALNAPTAAGGLGLMMYGGKLNTCGHQADGTYELVAASYADGPLLGKVSGKGFVYVNALPTDPDHIDLSNPAGLAATLLAYQATAGFAGVFVDNVTPSFTGYQPGQLLAFLRALRPLLAGRLLMLLNVSGYMRHGDIRDDNGTSQAETISDLAGLADYMMCENWQQVGGGAPAGNLRTRGQSVFWQWWDQWQAVVAATHAAGAKFVCLTYGHPGSPDGTTPIAKAIYGRASMLLAAGVGPGDVFFYNNGDGVTTTGTDPYDPAWCKPNPAPTVNPAPPVSASL